MSKKDKNKIPRYEQERRKQYLEYLKSNNSIDTLTYDEWKRECRIHGPNKNPHLFALPSIVSSADEKVELPRCAVLNLE